MPHLNGTGPEGKGAATGRKLGKCKTEKDSENKLGLGLGKKRKSGGGDGKMKRLKSGENIE